MKKSIITFFLPLFPILASASNAEIDGIYYNLIAKTGVAKVTSGDTKYSGDIVIPPKVTYGGVEYSVTEIERGAFEYCYSVNSVVIPNSMASIGEGAFQNCGLKSIVIPSSVTSIGSEAFLESWLSSIVIPNSVTFIDACAFSNCDSLTSIEIQGSITSISNNLFAYCGLLNSVKIPNSVTSIEGCAFSHCYSLSSIDIPNGVTEFGWGTFWGCSSLESTILPEGLEMIPQDAFRDCSSLKTVYIPNSVNYIDASAFFNCSSLSSLKIPDHLSHLGPFAFYGCRSLSSLTLPESLNSVEAYVFGGCSSLTSINIPENAAYIGEYAFTNCVALTTVETSNRVASIGKGAFQGCSSLKTVSIGSGVTSIDNQSFAGCINLEEFYCYPKSVPSTPSDAFQDSYIEYSTLYVPEEAYNSYLTTKPWSDFKEIKSLSGTIPDPPQPQKCATPTIMYQNGELTFICETEGAKFASEITDMDIRNYHEAKVLLTLTYNISVYAMKAGYENSDVAYATLCWTEAEPKTEGIEDGIAQIPVRPVLIQMLDGIIKVTGAEDGQEITVYDTSGQMLGRDFCINGAAEISTNLHRGSTVVVRIGDKAVRIMEK